MLDRFEWLELREQAERGGVAASPPDPLSGKEVGGYRPPVVDEPEDFGPAVLPRVEVVPVGGRWPLEPARYFLMRRQVDALRLSSGFDRLLCLDACRIQHLPHQQATALRVLREMGGRALLADEVGLGKTIEAGLVLKELIVRGLANRVLVLTPAALTAQWQEELADKFGEAFDVVRDPDDWQRLRLIASLDLARAPRHEGHALGLAHDLVIVDEAHKLKRRDTRIHQLVARLNTRHLLLLTATPVMNDLGELYNLVNLLSEGRLGTPRGFEARFMDAGDPRAPVNEAALRERLTGVMVRHRRDAVGLRLPPRRAGIFHLAMTEAERNLYRGLTAFILDELAATPDQGPLRLTLGVLQRSLTSTPEAVASVLRTLLRDPRREADARARLAGFLATAEALGTGRKVRAVAELLDRAPGEQVLVYTEFRRSQEALADHLREHGLEVVCFHGGLDPAARVAAVDAFRSGARVMISTESGAEGLNLQFCHSLINFDLPWNPMRIEQRIGRLHRLGQTRPVTIVNLAFEGTIEGHVVDLLARKIRLFELVVGELDAILGDPDAPSSFEALVMAAWSGAQGLGDLAPAFDGVAARLDEACARYALVQRAGDALSRVLATGDPGGAS